MSFLFPGKNSKDGYYLNILLLEKELSAFFVLVEESRSKVLLYKNIEHGFNISKGVDSGKILNLKNTFSKFLSVLYVEAANITKKKSLRLEVATVVLGCPWFFPDEMKLFFEGKDISISKSLLMEELESRFQSAEGKKVEPLRPMLLEKYINSVKLNGYNVAHPYDRRAQRIDVDATTISTFPEVEYVIEKEVSTLFHGARSRFISLPKLFSHRNTCANYLVMDSSSTLLVRFDAVDSIRAREINYGVGELVKAAAEVFGSESESNTLSYLKMAKDDVLLDAVSSKVLAAVRERMVDWKFLLKKSLTELDAEGSYPLVLVYRRGLSSFTSNFIKDELPFSNQVELLELETLSSDPLQLGI